MSETGPGFLLAVGLKENDDNTSEKNQNVVETMCDAKHTVGSYLSSSDVIVEDKM